MITMFPMTFFQQKYRPHAPIEMMGLYTPSKDIVLDERGGYRIVTRESLGIERPFSTGTFPPLDDPDGYWRLTAVYPVRMCPARLVGRGRVVES